MSKKATQPTSMLTISDTNLFKDDVKNLSKQQGGEKALAELAVIIDLITHQQKLPDKNRFHKLKGKPYVGYSSCHVQSDLCLVWKINKKEKSVVFLRLGTHSEIY